MLKHFICLFLFLTTYLHSESHLLLKGYLSREVITVAKEQLQKAEKESGKDLVIQVNSSSGDIYEVLSLSKKIYNLKTESGKHMIVYIQGKAVGPAAIFPFLADEIIATPLVAWGDIPYGVGDQISNSAIQNSVTALINPKAKQALTLKQLAQAMTDPYYKLAYGEGEVKIEQKSDTRFDPLILNLKGIESLGLLDKVLSDEAFQEKYISEKQRETSEVSELNERMQKYISYSETENNLIGYLHIGEDHPIDQSTYIYVKFALKEFIEKSVRFVVLDLNTPGGEVLSALKIVDLLQKLDIQHHIPVVAFVHDWAVSAGAMLAYSCRFIGIEPNSLMGAAEPVHVKGEGQVVSASEKINSALRAEFSNLAVFYKRNPLIAEAMVDKDIILVIRNDQIVQLRSEEEVRTSDENPDTIIIEKGKLLTLNAKRLMDYGVADFEVPLIALPEITDKEKEEGIWPAKKMLVFQQPYLAQIPHAIILDYQDWRVGFFTLLAHPVIASLLFVGLIIGFYIEINTPGFGIPGAIGIGCLALILLSSFASQAINWIEIIILCIGLILLALELFVIPGFGIIGILGIILTIVGLFALMLPGIAHLNILDQETFHLVGFTFIERLAWLCGSLIFAIIVIFLLAKFFSHRYFRFSKLILRGEQETKEGYISGIPIEKMPNEGDIGETLTPLRPSGKVHIGENLFDAITQGGYLESHVTIEVIRIEGSKVVVRPLRENEV